MQARAPDAHIQLLLQQPRLELQTTPLPYPIPYPCGRGWATRLLNGIPLLEWAVLDPGPHTLAGQVSPEPGAPAETHKREENQEIQEVL